MDKVVLAFSGGLDTSVCVKLLEEKYDVEVITACVDVGQGDEEIAKAEKMAKEIGGYKHYTIDAKEEFANEYIARGIKANAEYEGYPLSTALARPLIAQKIIDIAKKEGATAIAHGCTGKGNDQFRFEAVILAMSDLDIIAPIRELNLTRTEEQAYAAEKGIKLNSDKIYSIDENIWGRSIEGDILEDPANEPPEEIYAWTASAEDALDTPQKVSIEFEEGIPVARKGRASESGILKPLVSGFEVNLNPVEENEVIMNPQRYAYPACAISVRFSSLMRLADYPCLLTSEPITATMMTNIMALNKEDAGSPVKGCKNCASASLIDFRHDFCQWKDAV